MVNLKIVFSGDVTTTIKSKKINEDKLAYFLEELSKTITEKRTGWNIKIYRGTRKSLDCFVEEGDFLPLFNKWLDYRKNKIT